MSTPYGEFKSRDGKPVYADATEVGQRISLCGRNDADVYFSLGHTEADALLLALALAYEHVSWLWPDPLGEESSRNAALLGVVRAALADDGDWRGRAEYALALSERMESGR